MQQVTKNDHCKYVMTKSLALLLGNMKNAVYIKRLINFNLGVFYWDKGNATEVAKLLVEFGFSTLNLHRIFATCDPRNLGSAKVLEKIGMTYEGRIRQNLLLKDGWRDSLLFSILKHEWISCE